MMNLFGIGMGPIPVTGIGVMIEALSEPLPSWEELENIRKDALISMKELKLQADLDAFLASNPDPEVAEAAKRSTEAALKKLREQSEQSESESKQSNESTGNAISGPKADKPNLTNQEKVVDEDRQNGEKLTDDTPQDQPENRACTPDKANQTTASQEKTNGTVEALEDFIIAQAALYYQYTYADPVVISDLSGTEEATVRKYLNAKHRLPESVRRRLTEVSRDYHHRTLQIPAQNNDEDDRK